MNLFQIITLPVVSLLFLRSLLRAIRGEHPRRTSFVGAIIWLLAAIAIIQPDITIRIAQTVGIGRGADLLLYFLVIAFLVVSFHLYNRFQKLDSDISEIVRYLAIHEAAHRYSSDNSNEETNDNLHGQSYEYKKTE